MSATVVYSATGKRKNAIAKVRLKPGNGKVVINGEAIAAGECGLAVSIDGIDFASAERTLLVSAA